PLALDERQIAQIFPAQKQQIKGKKDQLRRLLTRKGALQHLEARHPARIDADHLAVDQTVRQRLRRMANLGKALTPVQSLASAQYGRTRLDPQLQAVAIELHLMRPAAAARWPLDESAELWLHELWHGHGPMPPGRGAMARGGDGCRTRGCAGLGAARGGRTHRLPHRPGTGASGA